MTNLNLFIISNYNTNSAGNNTWFLANKISAKLDFFVLPYNIFIFKVFKLIQLFYFSEMLQ